ncbi:MAG: dihydrofolate reductase [Lachnospiraceae bacterium]|nr:dihydrofolate reductase [Lachnospiraceae bacterium]MBP3505472.1 dihydrofolate reductase [Lachnospiraceae bacterium]
MNAIVAVDNHWAIGNKGSLLVRIPMDQKMFRETTIGKVVILGRKTLATFPNGLPLQGRTNIVMSRNPNLKVKGAVVVHSKEELFEELKQYASEDIFVIGGSDIYDMLVPYCKTAYVTKIDYRYAADAYFPNLDEKPEWQMTEEGEEITYFDLEFAFCKYENANPIPME